MPGEPPPASRRARCPQGPWAGRSWLARCRCQGRRARATGPHRLADRPAEAPRPASARPAKDPRSRSRTAPPGRLYCRSRKGKSRRFLRHSTRRSALTRGRSRYLRPASPVHRESTDPHRAPAPKQGAPRRAQCPQPAARCSAAPARRCPAARCSPMAQDRLSATFAATPVQTRQRCWDPVSRSAHPATPAPAHPAPAGGTVDQTPRPYRPQALDVPVLVARDAPISTLDPNSVGAFAQASQQKLPTVDLGPSVNTAPPDSVAQGPQNNALPAEGIALVAARPAWVRVRGEDRSILYEQVMQAGDTWTVPASEPNAVLNVGESGAIYLSVNGNTVGPVGPSGTVTSDLSLDGPTLAAALQPVDPQGDEDLSRVLADLGTGSGQATIGQPKVLEDTAPGVMLVAVRPAWIRVRAADGTVIYETIMNAGDTYQVPATEEPPTLRVGESGAVYFAMNGQTYGPAGPRGSVTSDLALSVGALSDAYSVASIEADSDLARVVAELDIPQQATD